MKEKRIRTICKFCGKQCHLLAEIDGEGHVSRITPDSEYKTIWCATGKNGLNLMNHPDRIRVPLKRTGEKGANEWEEISWEQAFSEVGNEFRKAIDTYGSNSILGIRGFNKPYFNLIYERLMNTIGTVNSMGAANMCHFASMNAARETFGFMPDSQITDKTKFIVIWGSNPYNTNKTLAAKIQKACENGTKLIVIDPCNTYHAKKADVWAPIKPGTDMALALGLIHLVIENGWYDKAFVEAYTYGFDELKESVKEYSVKETADLTGLSEEMIQKLAEAMSQEGPGIVEVGNAMDHNMDGFQKCRAINLLTAVTGNVDKEGALKGRGPMSQKQMQQRKKITRAEICPYNNPEKRKEIIGYKEAFMGNFNESSGKALADALNTQEPYPVKAAYVQGGNPAMIWENREELVKAFCKLDFMVVSDFFMTPTAMLADILLPAAVYMEYESVMIDGNDTIYYAPNLVPGATAKSDLEIINEMGKAMGYEEVFWNTMEEYWDDFLEPFGVTMEQVRVEQKIMTGEKRLPIPYGSYRENGFPTATGKINLYSENMKLKGNDPLPVYYEYAKTSKTYPYLSTNYKSEYFYHTAGRQIEAQRLKEPEAIALVSRDIAKERHLKEGDTIFVSTKAGSVLQKVHIDEKMAAKTVALSHGWWYPEKERSPFVLEACSNNIVYDTELIGRELPSFTTRGLPCEVKRLLSYEDIYQEDSDKPYDVKIAFTTGESYLQTVEALKDKGFLDGKPQFILEDTCTETSLLIPALKKLGYAVILRSDGRKALKETCARCDEVTFLIKGSKGEENEKIRENIEDFIRAVRNSKASVKCNVKYIMYQYNMGERYVIKQWTEKLGLDMYTSYAGFDKEKRMSYLSGHMSTHDIILEAKKYFFHFLDDLEENEQNLYQKFQGREPVLVNDENELESEWGLGGNPGTVNLTDVVDYQDWKRYNQGIFSKTIKEPRAGLWWLWNRSE